MSYKRILEGKWLISTRDWMLCRIQEVSTTVTTTGFKLCCMELCWSGGHNSIKQSLSLPIVKWFFGKIWGPPSNATRRATSTACSYTTIVICPFFGLDTPLQQNAVCKLKVCSRRQQNIDNIYLFFSKNCPENKS